MNNGCDCTSGGETNELASMNRHANPPIVFLELVSVLSLVVAVARFPTTTVCHNGKTLGTASVRDRAALLYPKTGNNLINWRNIAISRPTEWSGLLILIMLWS